MKGLVILLIASVTIALCQAAHKRKSQKRGVQYDEFEASNYQNPIQLNTWSSQQFDSHDDNDDDDDTHSFEEEQEQHQPKQQSFDELGSWGDEQPAKLSAKPEWSTPWSSSSNSGWSSLGSAVKSKTIIKKIPVPYERQIKVDNPIYTPVAKHIPIEHPVPVVKWVEKRVPIYQDHSVIDPIIKEEHVPQPFNQKVRFILQKVYVHVPSPPAKQTIIIRKKMARRHSNHIKRRKNVYGWL